jgi:microcompartment protein CcmK/EutM
VVLGRVTGTVVATRKEERLGGLKLLVIEVLKLDRTPTGAFVVAADAVGAGDGEVVLVAQGSSARLTDLTKDKPVDAVVMAIVDTVDVGGEVRYAKGGAGRR